LCDGQGHPLDVVVTAGQVHESTALDTLLVQVDQTLFDAQGDPVPWPLALAGDKGYRADWIDEYLLDLEIQPVIPSKANEDRESRPVAFEQEQYRLRNIVERLIGWLKECRRVLTRFEKTAVNFVGMIKMAFIHRYLRLATR
jgi:transposase